jgi:hypothetical protein
MSWSLHLVLGLIVGAFLGCLVWGRMLRFRFTFEEQFFHVIIGVSLFGGAITSYWADRAWFGSSLFAPESPPQSRTSRACSVVLGVAGIGTFCLAVYRYLQAASRRSSHSMSALDIPTLLVWLLVRTLRTDTVYTFRGIISRYEAPASFWLYVVTLSLSIIGLVVHLFL